MRLVVDLGGRPGAEFHHMGRANIVIGSGPGADLMILDGKGISRKHTRVLARRGLLVVVDLATRRGTLVRGEFIRAPVVVAPGEPFFIDELRFRAWPHDADTPRPNDRFELESAESMPLGEERATMFSDVRRFVRRHGEEIDQWTVPSQRFDSEILAAWTKRTLDSAARASAYLPDLLGVGRVRELPCVFERVPVYVTLGAVDDAIADGRFKPSLAFTYSLAAQLLEAVSAFHEGWGPHGAICPAAFLLGLDGRLILRRPGPMPGHLDLDFDYHRDFLSPARKCGGPPSLMDDRFSLAALGWLGRLIPAGALAESPLPEIARGLIEGAVEAGLDPSAGQLAHIARLVYRELPVRAENHRPLS